MEQNPIDFKPLSRHLRKGLSRVRRLRQVVRCLTAIVYTATLCWFAFCLFGSLLVNYETIDYETSMNNWKYIMAGFIAFCIFHYAFMKSFNALNRQENELMAGILAALFPSARYAPTARMNPKALENSRLFATPGSDVPISSTCYGYVEIPSGDRCITVADVGVTSSNKKDFSYFNFLEVPYQYFIRPIFGSRIESTMHSFRGMFGCCALHRTFRGYVMLLPDHLEGKVGYLAQMVQGFKDKYGAKFVHLEDPEFEKLFVVYADDEVEARMILTPAMMRRLTALRKSFDRDLMLSFNGNMLYYASETPDGFLRPGRKSLDDEHLLEQLYREVNFCLRIESEINNNNIINK